MTYTVFTRRWWKEATRPGWPDNLEPYPDARRYTRATFNTEEEALRFCDEWNRTHKPGRYSIKAEYESN